MLFTLIGREIQLVKILNYLGRYLHGKLMKFCRLLRWYRATLWDNFDLRMLAELYLLQGAGSDPKVHCLTIIRVSLRNPTIELG